MIDPQPCVETDVEALLLCFATGPSPLLAVIVYDRDTGAIIGGPNFYDPLTGAPAVPAGLVVPCSADSGLPTGPGDCAEALRVVQCQTVTVDGTVDVGNLPLDTCGEADAVRVVQCEPVAIAGPIEVVPDPTADVRAKRANLLGVATWAVGVATVGKVKSVSIRRRPGGASGAVTISDNAGTVTTLLAGESETWSVTALEDEIVGPLSVASTAAATDVVVTWTEA